ncbi:DUF2339 domain-containing protein [Flavobacterium terrisoli]|uniref:DUF2339 domain-containing protein n=1 Tax=Flavobacterium terrisoli TaxID=3242195 RepID=UPI0025435E97|nr:DUF2339 domain-containing protein [Flavobacterium buctense]
MGFIIFVLAICIIILFINFSNLKSDNKFLKSILERYSTDLSHLKNEIEELKKSFEHKPSTEEIKPTAPEIIVPETIIEEQITTVTPIDIPVQEAQPVVEEPKTPDPSESELAKQLPILNYESHPLPRYEKAKTFETEAHPEKDFEKKVYEESAFSIFMKKAEKQFADNWTGILGTAIMVLGIGYLSIYTALKVAPLYRVLILWAYAGLLIGAYYFLEKKEKWTKTGLWLRSAGASLFLFGCFGASQIEPLTFIHNNVFGYSLIGLGIALNLYVGYIIKKQSFLSLHVILSILILCVIPEKLLVTFILAAITSTIGIILSYKEKWEYHLLIVIGAFIIFDIWFNAEGTSLSATENILAILGIVMVSASCMFMQYRSVYENTHFDKAAFITHLTNWILFAIGLILHSTGSHFKTFILFAGAIICFFMAVKARQKKIFWLYNLDGMIAFILCSLSIIMLNDWSVGFDIIACILYLMTIACLFVVYQQKEALLYKIFLGINHFIGVALIIFCALMISDSLAAGQITNALATSIALSVIALLVTVFTSIKKDFLTVDSFYGENSLSLNGLLSIVFSLFVILRLNDIVGNSFYYAVIILGLLWCLLKRTYDSKTFDIGRVFFLGANLLTGILILNTQEKSYADLIFFLGLLAVISFNWTQKRFYDNLFIIPFLCIVGLNIALVVLSFKYLSDYYILPVFSLFGIALLNHEFLWYNFKKKYLGNENETLLYIFYYVLAFMGSFILFWNASQLTNTELGLTCLGISIIEAYVLFAKRIRNQSEKAISIWNNFNLLNSELLLYNALLFGFFCIQTEYTTLLLSGLTIIAFLSFQKFEEFKRYSNYAFLMIIGTIAFSIYQSIDNVDSINKTILYITQAVSILISVGYYYLLSKTEKGKSNLFSTTLPHLQNFWIVVLLFIQVELNYLPVLFMGLALLNYWLISTEKIKIDLHTATCIGFLGIVISIFHSVDKLNSFDLPDWALQLGSVAMGIAFVFLLSKKEEIEKLKTNYQIVLNLWLSIIMFCQLEHKWLPVFWAATAILNLFLYFRKITPQKNISIVYYLLANLHLGFISFKFYEPDFLTVYLLIFLLLGIYIYLAYKWMEEFALKNSLMIYPATLSIGCFLFLSFDKGVLTFFWILEALGLLILGILLKEKYFRYVSLSLVGLCVVRLMFFDLSNTDFLIRALVLLGVGVVLLVMNSLFKKYKDRFD